MPWLTKSQLKISKCSITVDLWQVLIGLCVFAGQKSPSEDLSAWTSGTARWEARDAPNTEPNSHTRKRRPCTSALLASAPVFASADGSFQWSWTYIHTGTLVACTCKPRRGILWIILLTGEMNLWKAKMWWRGLLCSPLSWKMAISQLDCMSA